jgi:branched-chain amino acid transport system substrate-binding protein
MGGMGFVRALVLPALAVLLAAACSPGMGGQQPPKQGADIVIGVPMALSGDLVHEAALAKQGYDLWLDWANRSGGIVVKGVRHRVRLVYEDDASSPQQSAQVAEKMLTDEKASFLLGPYGTTNTAAAAAVADKHHVPMIAANGAARQIFMQGYRYVFGILASADQYPAAVLDMALTMNPKPATLAMLSADDVVSLAIARGALEFAASRGLQTVFNAQYPAGSTNLYPLVQQAKAKNPDIFVNSGHLLEAIAAHKAVKDLRLNAKMVAYSVGPDQPQFEETLGSSADFVVTASPWTPQARYMPSYYLTSAEYVTAYHKKFNTMLAPAYPAADSTAAGVALELAIERSQSVDPDTVRDALAGLDVNTFFGRIKFDGQGQNTFKNILVEQIQNNQIQTIYPPEVATASPAFPAPTWEARFGTPPEPPKPKLPGTGKPPARR